MSQITPVEEYKERIEDVLGIKFVDDRVTLGIGYDSVSEAKNARKRIVLQQKQLRQIKREANGDMKVIRAYYKTLSDNAQPSGGSILMGLFGKRGGMRSSVADQRRQLRQERDNMLEPYNGIKLTVDGIVTQLDLAKLDIDEWVAAQE